MTPRPALAATTLTVMLLALAGCNSAAGHPSGIVTHLPETTTTAAAPSGTTTTTTPQQVVGDPTTAVIAGWVAAQKALEHAELANDPLDPAIGQTMGGEQFIHLVQDISQTRAAGHHVVGHLGLGHPTVIAYTPTTATVHSCLDDGLIGVDVNGLPLPGTDGQHTWDSVTSTMIPGRHGAWVIVSGKVTQTPWSPTTTCSA